MALVFATHQGASVIFFSLGRMVNSTLIHQERVYLHGVCSFLSLNTHSVPPFYLGLCHAQEKQALYLVVRAPLPCPELNLNPIQLAVSTLCSDSSGMRWVLFLYFFQSSFVAFPLPPFCVISTGLAWISYFTWVSFSSVGWVLFCSVSWGTKIR